MKVGGLGDVVTSLSRAVRDLGHNVEIIFPKYDYINFNLVSSTFTPFTFYFKFKSFVLLVH